jgi:hypothetical protein
MNPADLRKELLANSEVAMNFTASGKSTAKLLQWTNQGYIVPQGVL